MNSNEAVHFDQPGMLDALLVEHAEQLLGLLGRDGQVVRANRALAACCGVTEAELLGRVPWTAPWREELGVAPEEFRSAFEAAANGKPTRLSGTCRQPYRDFELTLRPVADRTARPTYVLLEGRAVPAREGADASEGKLAPRTHEMTEERRATSRGVRDRSIACFPAPGRPGKPILLGGLSLDGTDPQRIERASADQAEALGHALRLAQITPWELPVDDERPQWQEDIFRLAGYSSADLLPAERDPALLFTPSSWHDLNAALMHAIRAREPLRLDIEMIRSDGEHRWIAVRAEALCDESGRVITLRGAVQDITDRKQATTRADGLSRLYAAISEVNKALIRCTSPEDVYRALCHAVVEHGEFPLAWVGVADPVAGRIAPVEAAGPSAELIVDTTSSGKEDLEGYDASLRAYREQRVCRWRNPQSADSRASRPAHVLNCAVALPLKRGGEPCGAFTVYGEEENVFDDESTRLLHDMADNVSFALDLFDREELRQQTDAALRASEARLLQAQTISKMGDWELDCDTGRMSWSQQLFQLFERDIALGSPDLNEILAFYTPETLDRTRASVRDIIDHGGTAEIEQAVILPSGRLRYHVTVIVPLKASSGRVTKLYGTVQDITERKLAERELLARTEEVEDLYQNAPCGYHSLDAEGRIVRINDTELQWLGYQRDEMFGRMTIFDILSPQSHAAFEEDFSRLKLTGKSRILELELVRKDGSTLPVLASSTALFDSVGNFATARTMLADDSQRKLLERERAEYVARVAELSRHLVDVQESERRQLASELHDHASPNLAALRITFANLADALPVDVLKQVEPLLDDAHALLTDTTTGIRDICTNLRPATLDYAGLVPALREYAAQFSRRTGIEVDIEQNALNAALLPNVQSLLFRITQEALTNTSKHASAKKIVIRLSETPTDVMLTIADDGLGFNPHELADTGSSPGLGLITMKERAEFAGGTFTLRSVPGEGTRITVVFDKNPRMHGRRASDLPRPSGGIELPPHPAG